MTLHRLTRALFVVLMAATLVACDTADSEDSDPVTPDPTPTTGDITGRIALSAGAAGSVSNTRIAIYQSFDDWNADRFIRQVAASGDGTFAFDDITPGVYYFDAFKDNNNNGAIDSGDFFGVLGTNSFQSFRPTPTEVRAGVNTNFDFQILIIP
ncbi:MAG: hypothetical protein AAGF99_01330 [Bacteroidota bacterium]